MNYIGMDAHSGTSFFIVINGQGKVVKKERVTTSEEAIIDFVRGLKGKKYLTFEELHLSQWLYSFLVDEVDELVVCSPIHFPDKKGPKNDKVDAHTLARWLRDGEMLVSVYHDRSPAMELRTLVAGYRHVRDCAIGVKNRMSALLKGQAIKVGSLYTAYQSTELPKKFDNEYKKQVWFELQCHLNFLGEQKKSYLSKFRGNVKQIKEVKLLYSIPGIGEIFANQLYAAIVCPHRFPTKNKFYSYCRIVRYKDESDGIVYRSRASFGRKDLKCVFTTASMLVLQGSSAIREFYDYHLETGKSTRAAKSAVRRKLAAIVLAVLKNGKPYDDERLRKELAEKRQKALKHSRKR